MQCPECKFENREAAKFLAFVYRVFRVKGEYQNEKRDNSIHFLYSGPVVSRC